MTEKARTPDPPETEAESKRKKHLNRLLVGVGVGTVTGTVGAIAAIAAESSTTDQPPFAATATSIAAAVVSLGLAVFAGVVTLLSRRLADRVLAGEMNEPSQAVKLRVKVELQLERYWREQLREGTS